MGLTDSQSALLRRGVAGSFRKRIREILGLLARDPPEFCSERTTPGYCSQVLRFLGLRNFAFPQHITCQPEMFGHLSGAVAYSGKADDEPSYYRTSEDYR